jgi:hypothetical protein
MTNHAVGRSLLLAVGFMAGCCASLSAGPKELIPLTGKGEALQARYSALLDGLKAEIGPALLAVDAGKKAAFAAAHEAVRKVPPQPNLNNSKSAPPHYAPCHPLYAQAQSNAVIVAAPLLADVDAFLAGDKLDAKLAKCALLTHATPHGLAAFAQAGPEQEKIIADLLANDGLIRTIMEAGGAFEGKYGQAMQAYLAIQKASERARNGLLQRFALASCLENPEMSAPKDEEMTAAQLGIAPEKATANAPKTSVDVSVEIYLNYEKAYLEGILDPAFATLPDFEYRFIFPEYELEHVIWFREMLRNYRPDHIVNPDYKWRYCVIVRTDVPYTSGVKRPVRPELNLTKFQDFFLEGGICGPRAFVGKLSTAAFGIPTRGARQTGHAAMSHWTPEGWTTVFGAHWTFNSWRGRCGLDFFLETQARRAPEEFRKVLRAEWIGCALGEDKVEPMQYGVGGGFWNALAFYKKLAIVEAARIKELAPTGEELAESNVESATNEVEKVEIPEQEKIVYGAGGVISIPSGAANPRENTRKIRFMKTIDGNAMQLHYGLAGVQPELVKYTVEVPKAGKYKFTALVCTLTVDREFVIRVNRRTILDVSLPYTKGMWQSTVPLELDLTEGRNSIQLTAKSPNKGFSIKGFTLTPVK